MKTLGDRRTDVPLSQFGSIGVFVKELDQLLLDGRIDLAVHSLKDVPPDLAEGTVLAAFPERADPRDVLVSSAGVGLAGLPAGARIGTSSARRLAQLRAHRPDLDYREDLRGNVDTRLRKVFEGKYDAIVLAAAGLLRLDRADAIAEYLPTEVCLPDAGQGTLAIQTRADDAEARSICATLDDPLVRSASLAERAVLRAFGGGCKVPVAAYALVDGAQLDLQGLVALRSGDRIVRGRLTGPLDRPEELGHALWDQLVARGALDVLAEAANGG